MSIWKSVLLEYALTTGEMRNHENLKAHVDGNTSHFMETMTIFGRNHNSDHFANSKSSSRFVNEVDNAKLVLLYCNTTLEIECGNDIIHSKLTNTVHVADRSRCSRNISKVHGP